MERRQQGEDEAAASDDNSFVDGDAAVDYRNIQPADFNTTRNDATAGGHDDVFGNGMGSFLLDQLNGPARGQQESNSSNDEQELAAVADPRAALAGGLDGEYTSSPTTNKGSSYGGGDMQVQGRRATRQNFPLRSPRQDNNEMGPFGPGGDATNLRRYYVQDLDTNPQNYNYHFAAERSVRNAPPPPMFPPPRDQPQPYNFGPGFESQSPFTSNVEDCRVRPSAAPGVEENRAMGVARDFSNEHTPPARMFRPFEFAQGTVDRSARGNMNMPESSREFLLHHSAHYTMPHHMNIDDSQRSGTSSRKRKSTSDDSSTGPDGSHRTASTMPLTGQHGFPPSPEERDISQSDHHQFQRSGTSSRKRKSKSDDSSTGPDGSHRTASTMPLTIHGFPPSPPEERDISWSDHHQFSRSERHPGRNANSFLRSLSDHGNVSYQGGQSYGEMVQQGYRRLELQTRMRWMMTHPPEQSLPPPTMQVQPEQTESPVNKASAKGKTTMNPVPPPTEEQYNAALNFLAQESAKRRSSGTPPEGSEIQEPVIFPEDRDLVTDWFYYMLDQLMVCRFGEEDRNTRTNAEREQNDNGFGGMQCIHCRDEPSKRKFFWSAPLRYLNSSSEIRRHVETCKHVPEKVRRSLFTIKWRRDDQMERLRRGSQKDFWEKMFKRINPPSSEEPQGSEGPPEDEDTQEPQGPPEEGKKEED